MAYNPEVGDPTRNKIIIKIMFEIDFQYEIFVISTARKLWIFQLSCKYFFIRETAFIRKTVDGVSISCP